MDNKRIAHLGFIETTIGRMASCSSAIKGWSIAIVAAIVGVGLFNRDVDVIFRIVACGCAIVLTFVMWFLDSFYLYQEKLYRDLYDIVLAKSEDEIDFSMDARKETIKGLGKQPKHYLRFVFNRTIWPVYISQMVVYFGFFIIPLFFK